jgi:hypothetical protein
MKEGDWEKGGCRGEEIEREEREEKKIFPFPLNTEQMDRQ